MKLTRLLLVTSLGMAPALAVHAFTAGAGKPRMEVVFLEPEKFTDVRDSYMSSDADRSGYLDQIREYLVSQSLYYVPDGQKLFVTFTDIDMAGDFEPWHGPQWNDVRIVKDIYPPRIKLSFRLVDAEGNVLKQGARDLRDLAFMMKISIGDRNGSVHHEKALLEDWLRSEFPRVRKG